MLDEEFDDLECCEDLEVVDSNGCLIFLGLVVLVAFLMIGFVSRLFNSKMF